MIMTRKQKKLWRRIQITAVLFAVAVTGRHWLSLMGFEHLFTVLKLPLFLLPYIVIGHTILIKAVGGIFRGHLFDENFLMALATVGAIILGEYPEAVFVLLFYEVGELFESLAVGNSRRSISALMDIRPDRATVLREGEAVSVSPEEVAVGELLILRPGETIPLDGVIREGRSSLNTAAMTGESIPRDVGEGDEVLSGCINESGRLMVEVTKPYGESTASRILRLVEESSANKAKSESFITRFAAVYTPAVVVIAVLVALVPPLLYGGWRDWIYRALNFLVISCPCALVISVPLTFFAGIGSASRSGILVKGSRYLERLAQCRVAVLDKTGTLTKGSFCVTRVCALVGSEEELLSRAALAESYSHHPLARSLRDACSAPLDIRRVTDVVEAAGRGVTAVIDGERVYVGNALHMQDNGHLVNAPAEMGTVIYVATETQYLGYLLVSDVVKPEAAEALAQLRRLGIQKQIMLTGDADAVASDVAGRLSMDGYYAELLPDGKLRLVEDLLNTPGREGTLLFAGDGINDAPVLARADVGVAMGAFGTDAAMEAADVVIMDDDLRRLATGVTLARRVNAIVRQNVIFSLAVKFGVLLLSALGLVSMWVAIFADVGVMILAVCNAMRAMKK